MTIPPLSSTDRECRLMRWAGLLVMLGLAVNLATLFSSHPLAFIAFAVIACPLLGLGGLLYLYVLLRYRPSAVPAAVERVAPGCGE